MSIFDFITRYEVLMECKVATQIETIVDTSKYLDVFYLDSSNDELLKECMELIEWKIVSNVTKPILKDTFNYVTKYSSYFEVYKDLISFTEELTKGIQKLLVDMANTIDKDNNMEVLEKDYIQVFSFSQNDIAHKFKFKINKY